MKSKKSSTLTLIAFGWNRQAIILVVSRPNEFIIHFCLLRLKRSHRPHVFAHVSKSSWSILFAIPLWIMCRARNDINTVLSLLVKTNLVKFPRISWVGRPLFAILVRLLVVAAACRFVVVSNRINKKNEYSFFFSFFFLHCRRWSIRGIGRRRYMVCSHRSAALSLAHIRTQIVDIDSVDVVR